MSSLLGPFEPASRRVSYVAGSQQSMASQNSFDDSRFDSGYSTQPNGEPPRKRKRTDSQDGMGPPNLPLDISMRSTTPTEPNESFMYDLPASQDFTQSSNHSSDTALPPLPAPSTDEQTEKMNLILDLFTDAGRTDYSNHPAILQLTGEDFNMPLDASANSVLHWAACSSRAIDCPYRDLIGQACIPSRPSRPEPRKHTIAQIPSRRRWDLQPYRG